MSREHTIAVNVENRREVTATGVDLYVDISGEAFVSGAEALKKAREVRDLVKSLGEIGISESSIEVVTVRASVSSGLIAKSSSATYSLRVRLDALDLVADTLGAVTTRKNAELASLDWRYEGIDAVHNELLTEALEIAEARSALICSGIAHKKCGVHSLTEKLRDQERPIVTASGDWGARRMKMSAAAVTKDELGLEVTHSKVVSLDVRIEYLIEPLGAEQGVDLNT